MDSEDLYIRLYEDFTPTAEYLQADSKHRNFLPEATVIAGLGAALGAFCLPFLNALGKAAADGIILRVKAAFKKSETTGDRLPLLEGLELLKPFLQQIPKMSAAQIDVCRDAVAAELAARGYPAEVARRTASDLVASLAADAEAPEV